MIIDALTLTGIVIFLIMTGILLKMMLRDQASFRRKTEHF